MTMGKESTNGSFDERLRLEELEKKTDKLQKKIREIEKSANFHRRTFESKLFNYAWAIAVFCFMTLITIFCVAEYEKRVDALQEEVIMLQEEVSALQNIESN